MATKRKVASRIAYGTGAALFVVMTIGVVAYAIYQQHQSTTNPTASTASPTSSTNTTKETKMLPNYTPTSTPISELRYEDTTAGTGDTVQPGATINFTYTGALATTGAVFDSGTIEYPLGNLIQGWQQGVPGMKVGGTRRLYIPSSLGYGAQGAGSAVPTNADLVFDITINSIK